ncbi:hypothetical protein [Paenibacillus sp. IHBB 10380]|uniref:hypothetical protein n=1 Tax=Paenibacillus sp. IHBB 10380 TaxID=1566358 RepID=UPI000695B570|nr:hypothetical protein [Paenibacillus sp. IHBB 10380]
MDNELLVQRQQNTQLSDGFSGFEVSLRDLGLPTEGIIAEADEHKRVGSNHSLTRQEMFHIPFELKGRAATQRYSIPGLPSLYLGSSCYICWEELHRPDLNTVNRVRVKRSGDDTYLDFGLTPGGFQKSLVKSWRQIKLILRCMNGS